MSSKSRINLDVFKVVCRAVSRSDSLITMANHVTQLLVAALQIKGCTIFVLNPETKELEVLASFGLSHEYLNKGPVMADKGICAMLAGKAIVVSDTTKDKRLQYPEEAKKEGIRSIVSICIPFYNKIIGGLRLYHHRKWEISERDLDYLSILAEHLGLAMMFEQTLSTIRTINSAITDLPEELFPLLT
ncbi:MAG: GAF domain-containing protein [Deltaproteobacteria bacterium]|nr:MAG: GAF domain-containing protein [Deltaproteobacteria bacterium]